MSKEFNSEDYNQRFGGIARLYGVEGLKSLLNARILVVGLGGVGSWAAESLARSGVGAITLVDLDDICITNTNRQLPAMNGGYGKLKISAMRDRILAINPQCQVYLLEEFFTEKTAEMILDNHFDYVIDAIDSLKNKCLLASKCTDLKIPLIITGGTAGKIDPTQIRLADLGESINDALLFRMRKRLRQEFNFPSAAKSTPTKKQKFHMMSVFSPEEPVYPTSEGGTCSVPDSESNLKLDCESGMGSVTHITALFGLMAAGHVTNTIAKKSIH
ncbi:MAG: tRNA threonylcarbamoyladenosine dehydratase [Bdellovibrionales bacterium]|nr:tRNA threonylcarbamoyladenosine dehydratase [Bdellovibrionales bacterium]